MFTFPPIERLGDADASASPASRSPAQSRSPKKKSPKKKRTLKMSSRVRVNDPDPDRDGQLGIVVALGQAAPWPVSVTLDDDKDVTVDEEFSPESLHVVQEVACVVCRSCLPEEEESDEDSELLRCQECDVRIHLDCLQPRIWKESDGVFCPRCITEEQVVKLELNIADRNLIWRMEQSKCQVCKEGYNEEDGFGVSLLLCDTCDAPWHINCLDPPLYHIPEGDWHCPPCLTKRFLAGTRHDAPKPTRTALKVPNMLPPAAAAAAAAALDSRQAQMELDEHEGGSNETWTDEEVFAALGLPLDEVTEEAVAEFQQQHPNLTFPTAPLAICHTLLHPLGTSDPNGPWMERGMDELDYLDKMGECMDAGDFELRNEYEAYLDKAEPRWRSVDWHHPIVNNDWRVKWPQIDLTPESMVHQAEEHGEGQKSAKAQSKEPMEEEEVNEPMEEEEVNDEPMEEEEAETGETVNGMPLQPFLDNGCQLEYLRLDSQVDQTAKDFPTDLCPHTLRQIQYTVFNELSTLYKDEWIDYSPGRTFEDFLLRWDKGTLFEELGGNRLPLKLVAMVLDTFLLEPDDLGENGEGLCEGQAESVFQDWVHATFGRSSPLYGEKNYDMYEDLRQEQQLIIIYHLCHHAMKVYVKPLHECPGITVTQEYWTDQFEILESGFDGEAPAEGELPADGGEPGAEPGGEQDEEAAPPPRPRKPRAPGSFCKTRWSDLGPKEIVRDMVEERIVHHVKFAGDLAVGNTRYTMDYKKSVNLRGTYNAAEWGPVCDRYDPPLPKLNAHASAAYPKGRHKAVFALIERLPQSIRSGDYTLAAAWLRGEVV